jgi:RecB family endonuclease NucS
MCWNHTPKHISQDIMDEHNFEIRMKILHVQSNIGRNPTLVGEDFNMNQTCCKEHQTKNLKFVMSQAALL